MISMLAKPSPVCLNGSTLKLVQSWELKDFERGPEPSTIVASIEIVSPVPEHGPEFDAPTEQLKKTRHDAVVEVGVHQYRVIGMVQNARLSCDHNRPIRQTFQVRGLLAKDGSLNHG